jgi:hypothetical protein
MNGRTVYISGPMTGYPDFNFPAFDVARDRALGLGWMVISPADMDREAGDVTPGMDTRHPEMVRTFVRRDVDALLSLRAEYGDAIALLPGWEKSKGAVAELAVARWLGLTPLNALTFERYCPSSVWDETSTLRGQFLGYLLKGSI